MAPISSHSSGCISSFGSTGGGSVCIPTYQLMLVLLLFGNVPSSGSLGVKHINHPWTYQVSYVISPSALVPLVLYKFLAECVTGQYLLLFLVAPCWMEVPWLSTILNILADIPYWHPIIKDLVMDVLVGWCSRVCKHCM